MKEKKKGFETLKTWILHGSDFNETIAGWESTPGEAPVISAAGNNAYFYTDEFVGAPGAGQATLTDANGGVDILNAAAVATGSTINLYNGSASTIAGRGLTVSGDVEWADGGDGTGKSRGRRCGEQTLRTANDSVFRLGGWDEKRT